MTKVSRFYYVQAPLGVVRHVIYSHRHSAGERTACGLRALKGWKWATAGRMLKRLPQCRRCNAVQP